MGLLSKNQENALRILKAKLHEARHDFIEATEIMIRLFNVEPDKDKDFPAWSSWNARYKLACNDYYVTFGRLNKALCIYQARKQVYLLGY